jgi:hypothetical protein
VPRPARVIRPRDLTDTDALLIRRYAQNASGGLRARCSQRLLRWSGSQSVQLQQQQRKRPPFPTVSFWTNPEDLPRQAQDQNPVHKEGTQGSKAQETDWLLACAGPRWPEVARSYVLHGTLRHELNYRSSTACKQLRELNDDAAQRATHTA